MALDTISLYLAQNSWEITSHSLKEDLLDMSVYTKDNMKIVLVKPLTFMNLSGKAARYLRDEFYIKDTLDFLVIMDELDLAVGSFKLAKQKYSKTHNGALSIKEYISDLYWNLRFGIGKEQPTEEYVLKPFSDNDMLSFTVAVKQSIPEIFSRFLYNK